jgi:hypothetical protein
MPGQLWTVSSIEGSDPSLSAAAAKRQHLLGNRTSPDIMRLTRAAKAIC